MRFTRAVFIRCIGGIFLLAFLSAASQMRGLYGSQGISPIGQMLGVAQGHPGLGHLLNYPSLFWFDYSDSFLVLLPLVGAFFSLLALLGILGGPCILISWLLYLSIVTVGQEFMSFQWDILLLETGFLCIFLGSWRPFDFLYSLIATSGFAAKIPEWMVDRTEPPIALIWLCRWLLFRLMFQSGMCKLDSGDENWRNFSAMTYHYETQPLPTPIGWFAHQLPDPMQLFSTGCVFLLEGLLPFAIFFGRRARSIVAIGTISLQILILLTGNYCFFNLLTIALSLLLVDDKQLLVLFIKGDLRSRVENVEVPKVNQLRNLVVVPVVILIVFLSTCRPLLTMGGARSLPPLVSAVLESSQQWHLVSSYGLFAVMTTSRPEIAIEGSMDGKTWKEYIFKYKPGPLDRAPPVVAPHQPRLDWQMWFAALGSVFDNQWLVSFAEKLLDGSPDVLALLASDPFKGQKPKFIRANVYDYHLEDIGTLMATGKWWKRKYKGVYLPTITKNQG
ncbi:MAG: lipase maturation factor family protein [Candidatus Melainabacteria bacterium]|mgnify:CR=1 FL=1|nr:lipase maturation factor family protein [Candidatus Melainabacteria bacterium]